MDKPPLAIGLLKGKGESGKRIDILGSSKKKEKEN
jgi:hypothetical protein